ncbi:ciliary neurotrophic factor [Anableps anableps]
MSGIRTRGMSRTTPARAADLAAQLQNECSSLLKLYRKKENLPENVAGGSLVSVSPPSSQLDTRGKLWSLHSALEQCHSLLESVITKEEQELAEEEKEEYENKRKMLKDRLSYLLVSIGELLRAAGGPAILTPSLSGSESDNPTTAFELKLWVYRIFMEVKYWSEMAITILQELQSDTVKEPLRRSKRSTRSTLR